MKIGVSRAQTHISSVRMLLGSFLIALCGLSAQRASAADPASLAYTGPLRIGVGDSVFLEARLLDETGNPIVGRGVDFTLGAQGLNPQYCQHEVTDGTGACICAIAIVSQDVGPSLIKLAFRGDGTYASSDVHQTVTIISDSGGEGNTPSDIGGGKGGASNNDSIDPGGGAGDDGPGCATGGGPGTALSLGLVALTLRLRRKRALATLV